MPNIQSAKKRLKQSIVRNARNRSAKKAIHTQYKKVVDAVKAGNVEQAESELRRLQASRSGRLQASHPRQRRRPSQVAAVGQGEEAQGQVGRSVSLGSVCTASQKQCVA